MTQYSKIVDLDTRRQPRPGCQIEPSHTPHIKGSAVCMNCSHVHENIQQPVGEIDKPCQRCGSHKLAWQCFITPPPGTYLFTCGTCASRMFSILERGYVCQGCGAFKPFDMVHGGVN